MRRTYLLLALTLLIASACADRDDAATSAPTHPTTAYEATEGQRTEIIGAVQKLFDALASGDADLLRAVVDPSVVMHFTETREGETTFGSSTVDGLADRITSSEARLIERMWDPIVAVNGSLATVWTPYDFYAGSTFSHCGVDAVSLMHGAEGWRIVGLSWTRLQPPTCELHPQGPPTS